MARCKNYPEWIAFILVLSGLIIGVVALNGCAATSNTTSAKTEMTNALESQWGVHVEGVRLTAGGHLVDFRYRVLDPNKAEGLMRRGDKAYLIDQASGVKLPVPVTKVGQLRGTGTMPAADRVYAVMFKSGGGIVKQGSLVTVVLGDFRAENLTVN